MGPLAGVGGVLFTPLAVGLLVVMIASSVVGSPYLWRELLRFVVYAEVAMSLSAYLGMRHAPRRRF